LETLLAAPFGASVLRAALRYRDHVREIFFGGWGVSFETFFRATNYQFPTLESLELRSPYDHDPDIPTTFLRGPDQSDLHFRHFKLSGASPATVSGLLLSALIDLTLDLTPNAANFDPSQGKFLPACLQGMQCLRSLDLTAPYHLPDSQRPTPKDFALLKLTRFNFTGPTRLLNNLMSELSAPSLQDAHFMLYDTSPLLYISRVIDDVREEFRSVSVNFKSDSFRLLLSTQSGKIDHFKPSFSFYVNSFPYSMDAINALYEACHGGGA